MFIFLLNTHSSIFMSLTLYDPKRNNNVEYIVVAFGIYRFHSGLE